MAATQIGSTDIWLGAAGEYPGAPVAGTVVIRTDSTAVLEIYDGAAWSLHSGAAAQLLVRAVQVGSEISFETSGNYPGAPQVGTIVVRTDSDEVIEVYDGTSWSRHDDDGAKLLVIARAPAGGGSGDVVGPASATDNAIARYDSTTGKLLQNSIATLSDLGVLTTANFITSTGGVTANFIAMSGGGDINMGTGVKVIFDSDLDSYIYASADDIVALYILGFQAFEWTVAGQRSVSASWGNIDLDGVGRLVLDGDADTYIVSPSDDTVNIFVAGTLAFQFLAAGLKSAVGTFGNLDLDGVGALVLDADADTDITSLVDDTVVIGIGGLPRLTFTNTLNTIINDTTLTGTGYLKLPSGTTGERPGSPAVGMTRHNTTTGGIEAYVGSAWVSLTSPRRHATWSFGDGTARTSSVYLRVPGNIIPGTGQGYVASAAGEIRAQAVNVNVTAAASSGTLTFSVYVNDIVDNTLDVVLDPTTIAIQTGQTAVAEGAGITIAAGDLIKVRAVLAITGSTSWVTPICTVETVYA